MTAAAHRVGRLPARPATFAADPHRRAMIAKLQIAKKQLGMNDDDYRELLARHSGGKRSSTELTAAQLHDAIEELKKKGFRQTTAASLSPRRSKPVQADHPAAKKARALWISLGQLGAIEDASEAALEAFAKRQLRCERLQWANGADMFKLVEALKAMATRAGWDQDMAGVAPLRQLWVLKLRLAEALFARLVGDGHAPGGWTLEQLIENDGVWAGGVLSMHWTLDGLEKVIAHLVKIRADAGR